MILAVGTGRQVDTAIPELETMLRDPVLTIERVQACKRDGELLARPAVLPPTDDGGRALWQKLMIHTSEATLHDGMPIHRAIVRRLRESRAASGATVLRGVWGFHGDHKPHGDKLIQLEPPGPGDDDRRRHAGADRGQLRHHRPGHRSSTDWSPVSWCPRW